MPASQEQKVDFLLKKIGYSASKTGIAEDSSLSGSTKKAPFAEAIASPLVIPSSTIWSESGLIPATPPSSNTTYVGIYTAANAYRMTYDNTVGAARRTFIARSSYGNQSSSIDGDWIDTQFGADYIVQVYKGDPNSGGVSLQQAGANAGTDGWFFDYSSGVLNFNGTNLPSGIGTDNVYVLGYRYIGRKGVQPAAGLGTFHDLVVSNNLSVSGISTFTGLVDANGGVTANTLIVEDLTNNRVVIAGTGGEIEDDANLTFDGAGLVVGANLNVTGVSTFGGIIEATAGENKIPSLYSNYSDLPNPSTYHGMFAHVHGTQKGYFAHAGGWYELVNKETTGVVGTGTEIYHIGDLNVTGITTLGSIGISTGRITGPAITYIDPATVGDDTGTVVIKGNLQIDGTQTTVNSSTMDVADKNVGIASGAANDAAADGAGITVYSGDGNKTWNWVDATDSWTSSEHVRIPDGKVFGFTPDTNTYIGRPAADTIAFTHGGNQRVHISSTQTRIGSQAATDTSTGTIQLSGFANDDSILSLYNPTTNNGEGINQGFFFKNSNNNVTEFARITSTAIETTAATVKGDLRFYTTNGNDTPNMGEKVRITSDGKVGINSTAPTAKLDVIGDTKLQGNVSVGGATTISNNLNVTSSLDVGIDLDVDGRSELDIVNISETLSVSGISTFSKEVGIGSALSVAGVSTHSEGIFVPDDKSIRVGGTFANPDLKIHSSSTYDQAVIDYNRSGTGRSLRIRATNLQIENWNGLTPTVKVIGGAGVGHVELNYAGDKKFETTSSGVGIAGSVTVSNDLDVTGISTFSGDTKLGANLNVVGISTLSKEVGIGSALNVAGISTLSKEVGIGSALSVVGVSTFNSNVNLPDNTRVLWGNATNGDFGIYHDTDHSYLHRIPGGTGDIYVKLGGDDAIVAKTDSSVELYWDNFKKLETLQKGVGIAGSITVSNDLSVTGVTTTGTLNTGDTTFTGTISAGSTTGTDGYYLKSVGTGVTWAAFPTVRTGLTTTATAGQTTFNFSYNIGYVDVFLNGVKLPESEFTATNGSTIVLDDAAFVNDTLEFISLNTTPGSSSGAQVLNDLADVDIGGTLVNNGTLHFQGSKLVKNTASNHTTTSTSSVLIGPMINTGYYKSAEFLIQAKEGTKYHLTKILAVTDGTDVFFNEYGTLTSHSALATYTVVLSGSFMRVNVTPASSNSTNYRIKHTLVEDY